MNIPVERVCLLDRGRFLETGRLLDHLSYKSDDY
jgi:hypothetical protein